jgi:hypothetical protein
MEEADADGGCVACAAGLDGGEGNGALEDVLGCFAAAVNGMRPLKRTMFTDNRRCLATFVEKPPIQ